LCSKAHARNTHKKVKTMPNIFVVSFFYNTGSDQDAGVLGAFDNENAAVVFAIGEFERLKKAVDSDIEFEPSEDDLIAYVKDGSTNEYLKVSINKVEVKH